MINSGSRLDSIYFQFFFMFRFIVELLKMWVKIPERLSYPNPRFYERKTCMHFKVSVISNYHKTLLWWLTFAFYLKYGFIGDSQLNNIYFKERDFRADLLSRVIFLTFRVDLISRIGYRWIFGEDLL